MERFFRGRNRKTAAGKLMNYISERRDMINYPEFQAKGWQIGSGPTEARCKTTTSRLKGRDAAGRAAMRKPLPRSPHSKTAGNGNTIGKSPTPQKLKHASIPGRTPRRGVPSFTGALGKLGKSGLSYLTDRFSK